MLWNLKDKLNWFDNWDLNLIWRYAKSCLSKELNVTLRANIICTHKNSELAHGNGHASIGSRIGTNQYGLLSWTTRLGVYNQANNLINSPNPTQPKPKFVGSWTCVSWVGLKYLKIFLIVWRLWTQLLTKW